MGTVSCLRFVSKSDNGTALKQGRTHLRYCPLLVVPPDLIIQIRNATLSFDPFCWWFFGTFSTPLFRAPLYQR